MTKCDVLLSNANLEYIETGRKHPHKYTFYWDGESGQGWYGFDNRKGFDEAMEVMAEVNPEHAVLVNEFSQKLWTSDDGLCPTIRYPKYIENGLKLLEPKSLEEQLLRSFF